MFKKAFTLLLALAIVNGITIDAELGSTLGYFVTREFPDDLPQQTWEPDALICLGWVKHPKSALQGLCDVSVDGDETMRQTMTIKDLKTYAIENNFDGFTVNRKQVPDKFQIVGREATLDEVYFKRCDDAPDNANLTHAMWENMYKNTYLY